MTLGIYGSGGLGREVLILAQQINYLQKRWENFIFIDDFNVAEQVYGVDILPFDKITKKYTPNNIEIVIAIGEPSSRRVLRNKVRNAGYSLATLVHPSVNIPESTRLGSGAIICVNSFVSCDVTIGDNVLVQPNASIGHDNCIGNDTVISSNVCMAGRCNIGYETYIGMQVAIKECTKVGDQTIVGMGSVVIRDIPDQVIAIGNPARPMKRNEDFKVFSKKPQEERT